MHPSQDPSRLGSNESDPSLPDETRPQPGRSRRPATAVASLSVLAVAAFFVAPPIAGCDFVQAFNCNPCDGADAPDYCNEPTLGDLGTADFECTNTLTAQEQADGWELLFDGSSFNGWRPWGDENGSIRNDRWRIQDGMIRAQNVPGAPFPARDDLITTGRYADFELRLAWRLREETANSGIFIRGDDGDSDTPEIEPFPETRIIDWLPIPGINDPNIADTAHEMQILDNMSAMANNSPKTIAGAYYDMWPPTDGRHGAGNSINTTRDVGTWNLVHIRADGRDIMFELNGETTADFTVNSPEWHAAREDTEIDNRDSRWGSLPTGHIALQQHWDRVDFCNIRIREF